MTNLLYHLIENEMGTSAFLATLLDPRSEHPLFIEVRAVIASMLNEREPGLQLSSQSPPTHVELEYLNIDLLAVWSGWIILIENKIAAASVTSGQLNNYYSESLLQLKHNRFLRHATESVAQHPICFLYLTPTKNVGKVEFDSLKLDHDRSDRKIHISWEELLRRLAPLCGRSTDHASCFFDAGIERIREVLATAKETRLPDDDNRYKIQALMNDMKGRLQNREPFADLEFSRWSDQFKEQLFMTGPTRSAYLGLYVSCGSVFPSESSISAVGDISFDVASKHRSRLRYVVSDKSLEEWSAMLGVPCEAIRRNVEKGSLSWRFELPEIATDVFLHEMAQYLAVFLSVFRPFLVETTDQSPD